MTDMRSSRKHYLLVAYLPTVVTTIYLLALWMLSYRQLPALERIYDNVGADLPVLFAAIKAVGINAPLYISLISVVILLLIYFKHELGLFISVLWLAAAFWLSWMLISFHSSAWISVDFSVGIF
ncbi:MAG: hypothetical protein KAT04_08155 [Methylococcales bacterium]|nr:hypothetical protein [Methylococcales bacterium]